MMMQDGENNNEAQHHQQEKEGETELVGLVVGGGAIANNKGDRDDRQHGEEGDGLFVASNNTWNGSRSNGRRSEEGRGDVVLLRMLAGKLSDAADRAFSQITAKMTTMNDDRAYNRRKVLLVTSGLFLFTMMVVFISTPGRSNVPHGNNSPEQPGLSDVVVGDLDQLDIDNNIVSTTELGINENGATKVALPELTHDGGGSHLIAHKKYVMELANLLPPSSDVGGSAGGANNNGTVVIAVVPTWAPIAAHHFEELVGKYKYYDDCRFYKVVDGVMVQFGLKQMRGLPRSEKKYTKVALPDEPPAVPNLRGRITYAAFGDDGRPDATTKQRSSTKLVINTGGDNADLDALGYAPFATVLEGMEYVDRINNEYAAVASASGDASGDGDGDGDNTNTTTTTATKPALIENLISSQGSAYLSKEFPNLSYIVSIREAEE